MLFKMPTFHITLGKTYLNVSIGFRMFFQKVYHQRAIDPQMCDPFYGRLWLK